MTDEAEVEKRELTAIEWQEGTLKALLRELAANRIARDEQLAKLGDLTKEFDAAHFELIADVAELKESVALQEAIVRDTGLALYSTIKEVRGEKAKVEVDGITVTNETTMTVTDEAAALAWAVEHKIAVVPVSLDRKQIAKVAGAMSEPIPGIELKKVPKVVIARNLSVE